MKHYVLVSIVAAAAVACSDGGAEKPAAAPPAQPAAPIAAPEKGTPAYTLENNLPEFWIRKEGAPAGAEVRSDHKACQAETPREGHALTQLKGYIDCMGAKGWKQEPSAWQRLAKESSGH